MPFKPNYRFERNQRSQAKAAKKEAKRADRVARRAAKGEVGDENTPDGLDDAEVQSPGGADSDPGEE